jgi:hypothetical protein
MVRAELKQRNDRESEPAIWGGKSPQAAGVSKAANPYLSPGSVDYILHTSVFERALPHLVVISLKPYKNVSAVDAW